MPDLPVCVAAGKSREEVLNLMAEGMGHHLSAMDECELDRFYVGSESHTEGSDDLPPGNEKVRVVNMAAGATWHDLPPGSEKVRVAVRWPVDE